MKKKILVIEDENNIRENMTELLVLSGYEVESAANGHLGVICAMKSHPDLVICDITMPEMDGYEVLKLIRENNQLSNLPFIFVTAKADRNDFRTGMNLGADDYLTKPFQLDELLQTIKTRFDRKEKLDKSIEEKIAEIQIQMNQTTSHEYNTPLNGILGFSDLILNLPDNFEKDKIIDFIRLIHQSGLRLKRTVEKSIMFKTITSATDNEAALKSLSTGRCAISNEEITNICQNIAAENQRTKDLVIDVQPAILQINGNNLEHLIFELADNAFKFSKEGTPVTVSGILAAKEYHLSVHDRGRGFLPESISQIGPFIQFEKKKFEQQGSGLGLFIAKRLTELNQGTLEITSIYGNETTISVKLLAE